MSDDQPLKPTCEPQAEEGHKADENERSERIKMSEGPQKSTTVVVVDGQAHQQQLQGMLQDQIRDLKNQNELLERELKSNEADSANIAKLEQELGEAKNQVQNLESQNAELLAKIEQLVESEQKEKTPDQEAEQEKTNREKQVEQGRGQKPWSMTIIVGVAVLLICLVAANSSNLSESSASVSQESDFEIIDSLEEQLSLEENLYQSLRGEYETLVAQKNDLQAQVDWAQTQIENLVEEKTRLSVFIETQDSEELKYGLPMDITLDQVQIVRSGRLSGQKLDEIKLLIVSAFKIEASWPDMRKKLSELAAEYIGSNVITITYSRAPQNQIRNFTPSLITVEVSGSLYIHFLPIY